MLEIMMSIFLKGMILGFAIAAPVGPIGVLCIRKTLQYGRKSGLLSGVGAATADAVYGAIAAFGLTTISLFLAGMHFWLTLIGGLFLLYLGLKTMLSKPVATTGEVKASHLTGDFLSTFFLTLTNPMTILSFVAVFAGMGLATSGSYSNALLMVIGVFVGSALWWLILSEVVTLFRKRISGEVMKWVNRTAGFIIILFGLFALLGITL